MKLLQHYENGEIPIDISPVKTIKLLEFLGGGGFGKVWRVVDVDTKKLYVLKILQLLNPGSIDIERVRMEAEVKIHSLHIIPTLGLTQWDDTTFLILFEYVEGKSLDKLLAEGSLSKEQKRAIFHEILLGVSAAHFCNIIHRDLKPENILITLSGEVKIIDFGISKFKDNNITEPGTLMGTLPWIPPEILLHGAKIADARTDIYALGHILYELATGKHFWDELGWGGIEGFGNYLNREPCPKEAIDLRTFTSDLFPNLKETIALMVKVDVEERHPNIRFIIEALNYHPEPPPTVPAFVVGCPILRVETGSNRGAISLLDIPDRSRISLGRMELAGNDTSISRQHVEFYRSENRYYVRDLGSKNGSWLRGLVLTPTVTTQEIHHGDSLKVGDIFLKFLRSS
jgi:eukaryotic-like serine/threonine-protein kinase